MALVPLADRVYIIPIEDPDQTESGLWIPDEAKQRADQGIIKYRGSEVKELRVGDHVLFGGYSGTQIVLEDEGLLYVMKESDVLGLIDDEIARRLVTTETINRIVEQVVAKTISYDGAEREFAEKFGERFKSFLNDHFYSELQF